MSGSEDGAKQAGQPRGRFLLRDLGFWFLALAAAGYGLAPRIQITVNDAGLGKDRPLKAQRLVAETMATFFFCCHTRRWKSSERLRIGSVIQRDRQPPDLEVVEDEVGLFRLLA